MTQPVTPPQIDPPRDEGAFRKAVEQGLAEAEAGLGTPFEQIAPWLDSWGADDETPTP